MARYITVTETAKYLREALQKAFPMYSKRFFSVKSKSYAGGASIAVSWRDGPTSAQVDPILEKFAGATFDGTIDLKNHHISLFEGEEVHFGADYVNGYREHSEKLVRAVTQAFIKKFACGHSPKIVVCGDGTAFVDRNDSYRDDIMSIAYACSEEDVATLEIGIVDGKFAILQKFPVKPFVIKKCGMLTRIGARKLGWQSLAGEIVNYEEVFDNDAWYATCIEHPKMGISQSTLLIGDSGVVDNIPPRNGILTDMGAKQLSVPEFAWENVFYHERMIHGIASGYNIYCFGDKLFGSLEFGINGILPKIIGPSFQWFGQENNYEIIKEVKQQYQRDWVDEIEVTILDNHGEQIVQCSFVWYHIGSTITMKLEIEADSFVFFTTHAALFQEIANYGKDVLAITIATILKTRYTFTQRMF